MKADNFLEEMRYKISIGDVFTLYEAIGFIEANANEYAKNMLYSLKNVAYKVNWHLTLEEQEAIQQAIKKERKDEEDSDNETAT